MPKFNVIANIRHGVLTGKRNGNDIPLAEHTDYEPGDVIELTNEEAAAMPHAVSPVKQPKEQKEKE